MEDDILVVVDTAHIQPYIFGSNRLRENIGASYLVSQVTGAWAFQAVKEVAPGCNVTPAGSIDEQKTLEGTPGLQAEVIYSGGGNFVVVFRGQERAEDFSLALSRRALRESPGLELVLASQPLTWRGASGLALPQAVTGAFKQLEAKKRRQAPPLPLLGLGVTEACLSTGLPAVGMTPPFGTRGDSFPAAAAVLAKHKAVKAANERLARELSQVLDRASARLDGKRTDFPHEFDFLGRSSGEFSYIAVIHADGNGVGQRILELGQHAASDRDYVAKMRAFSQKLSTASKTALVSTLNQMVEAIDPTWETVQHLGAGGRTISQVQISKDEVSHVRYLPVRPLVYGGDDLTLVCDGRLGLSLAAAYLRHFEQATLALNLPDGKGALSACAGISVVKSHYPFARAYTLAEELCASAKQYRRKLLGRNLPELTACLDWHFALSGIHASLPNIRQREYQTSHGCLALRPVTLGANVLEDMRAWDVVRKGIEAFQEDPAWRDERSKVKALRDALRGGPEAVRAFRLKYLRDDEKGVPKDLPNVADAHPELKTSGWSANLAGYFDAIEWMDWFLPLPETREEGVMSA